MVRVKVSTDPREEPLPDVVLLTAAEAALRVVDNYRRAGTPCGHERSGDTEWCGVMVCEFYVGRMW